jgi:hypothetical protein
MLFRSVNWEACEVISQDHRFDLRCGTPPWSVLIWSVERAIWIPGRTRHADDANGTGGRNGILECGDSGEPGALHISIDGPGLVKDYQQ